jgi:hypothetical protein
MANVVRHSESFVDVGNQVRVAFELGQNASGFLDIAQCHSSSIEGVRCQLAWENGAQLGLCAEIEIQQRSANPTMYQACRYNLEQSE